MSKNSPKVSIIIPLFNQKQFVREAVESVLSQTYTNTEVIVVNDGSTDDPLPKLDKYKGRITIINQENRGLAGARNTGIRNASGEYIQLLDADDFLHKDKIRLQLDFCLAENCDISYCEVVQYDNETGKTTLRHVGDVADMFASLYNFWLTYPLPVHSMLIKKEIFDKFGLFDEGLRACEDRYYFSRLSSSGVNFKYFPFIGGFRRQHGSNMNRDRPHIIENTLKYYEKINSQLDDGFFMDRFGYSGDRMMKANLTFIYLTDLAEGTPRSELKSTRNMLGRKQITFDAGPIPSRIKIFKLEKLFLVFYLKRYLRSLYGLFGSFRQSI